MRVDPTNAGGTLVSILAVHSNPACPTVVVLQEGVKAVQVTQSLPHHYMPLSH